MRSKVAIAGATGTRRRSRIAERCSRASSKAVLGARTFTCPAYFIMRKSVPRVLMPGLVAEEHRLQIVEQLHQGDINVDYPEP